MSDDQLKGLIARSVTISVPATIANLGVGYGVLGMATDTAVVNLIRDAALAK
jgi:homoserine kinase